VWLYDLLDDDLAARPLLQAFVPGIVRLSTQIGNNDEAVIDELSPSRGSGSGPTRGTYSCPSCFTKEGGNIWATRGAKRGPR